MCTGQTIALNILGAAYYFTILFINETNNILLLRCLFNGMTSRSHLYDGIDDFR